MLELIYCNGDNCLIKNMCQNYSNYLYKLEIKQETKEICLCSNSKSEHFDLKRFVGD